MGITTAINSDDAEMGRRLNQEAAKSIKYGETKEIDAMKFVTLHPARLLHLDKRMGSIAVGMDADMVLWSGHPLSVYSKVLTTWVDGIPYFDAQREEENQQVLKTIRSSIIKKMKEAKQAGEKSAAPMFYLEPEYHCDTETME
jgi:adenine deaminase